jgi:hypothetical protein
VHAEIHKDGGQDAGATIRRLAALAPRTLAVMHGSSFSGDAPAMLGALARFCGGRLQDAPRPAAG